jgi:hypothetical protein
VGFNELFDRSFGRHDCQRPYPRIIPSRIGSVLLPFACPYCNEVRSQVVDAKTRLGWHDSERDFSWCPSCKGRYVIDPKGTPLVKALPPGATSAPALVKRAGKTEVLKEISANGLDSLGAL